MKVKSISIRLHLPLLCVILLLCTHMNAQSADPKLPSNPSSTDPSSTDPSSIPFDPDFYGAVRIKRFEVSDLAVEDSHTTYRSSGILCYNYVIAPSFRFWDAVTEEFGYQHEIMHFVSANHIGVSGTHSSLNGALSFFEYKVENMVNLCVRKDPHREFGSITEGTTPQTFIDWIAFDTKHIQEPNRLMTQQFSAYQCSKFTSEYMATDHLVAILSIEHTDLDAEETAKLHYDAIWLTQSLMNTVNVCWADGEVEVHNVNISALILTDSHQSIEDTFFEHLGDVEFDRVPFTWPADEGVVGVCVEYPFEKSMPVTPFVFVAVEDVGGNLNSHAALYTWVERANENSFMGCVSKMYWSSEIIAGNTELALHYFAIYNPVQSYANSCYESPCTILEQPAHLKMTLSDITCTNKCSFVENVASYNELRGMILTKAGIEENNLELEKFILGDSLEFMYLIRGLVNPDVNMNALNKYITDNTDNSGLFTDTELDNIVTFKELFMIKTFALTIEVGGECIVSDFQVSAECSTASCSEDGGAVILSRNVLKESFGSRYSCPDTNQYSVACKQDPCITEGSLSELIMEGDELTAVAAESVASWGTPVLIVEAILLAAMIGWICWMIYRKVKTAKNNRVESRFEPKVIGSKDKAKVFKNPSKETADESQGTASA